jgi:hypothetical protein
MSTLLLEHLGESDWATVSTLLPPLRGASGHRC